MTNTGIPMERFVDANDIVRQIDGPLFKEQRLTVLELSSDQRLTEEEQAYLEGITNLLDSVADVAHDQFGIDCLLQARFRGH